MVPIMTNYSELLSSYLTDYQIAIEKLKNENLPRGKFLRRKSELKNDRKFLLAQCLIKGLSEEEIDKIEEGSPVIFPESLRNFYVASNGFIWHDIDLNIQMPEGVLKSYRRENDFNKSDKLLPVTYSRFLNIGSIAKMAIVTTIQSFKGSHPVYLVDFVDRKVFFISSDLDVFFNRIIKCASGCITVDFYQPSNELSEYTSQLESVDVYPYCEEEGLTIMDFDKIETYFSQWR